MNSKYLMLPALLGLMLFNSPSLMAGTAIQEMAGIMLQLQYSPSTSDKETLLNIANDSTSSDDECIVAMALMRVQHSVTDSEKTVLLGIADNSQGPAGIRTVASILANMYDMPSEADRVALESIEQSN